MTNFAYLLDAARLALISLRMQLVRTLLSMAGIAIGIAAFTVTASINQGGQDMVLAELETFGLNAMWIQRDYPMQDVYGAPMAQGSGIDNDDFREILSGCCPAVGVATPILHSRSNKPAQAGNMSSNGNKSGVGRDYLRINNDTVIAGRRFNAEDEEHARKVVLIGTRTRDDLFPNRSEVIGETLQIDGVVYEVVGVLAEKNRAFLDSIGIGGGIDANRRILLPYTTMQRLEQRQKEIDTIQVQAAAGVTTESIKQQVGRMLRRNHGKKYDYRVDDLAQYVQAAERIMGGISLVGLLTSALTLFVGGIGVANVMAMAVLERTREIGVRKAIGATRAAVLGQFAMEATMIGTIGGLVGIALSYGVISIGQQFSPLAVNPSGVVLASAVLAAALAGIVAGLYPSYVAATMRPTDALRT